MSIVAVTETMGSLGNEIGLELARRLSYQFADREIIAKAAERYGEGVMDLAHVTEEKPTLWERFTDTRTRYLAYIEAIITEMAAGDRVVLSGRGAIILLRNIRHVLRVRITAPWRVRAERVVQQQGLTDEAAADLVRRTDRERASRVRFLYDVDLDDPLLYDLVLNTERLGVDAGARILADALAEERYQPTSESRRALADLNVAAQVRASLKANPVTRSLKVQVECQGGRVMLTGTVDHEEQRRIAYELATHAPGAGEVANEVVVIPRSVAQV